MRIKRSLLLILSVFFITSCEGPDNWNNEEKCFEHKSIESSAVNHLTSFKLPHTELNNCRFPVNLENTREKICHPTFSSLINRNFLQPEWISFTAHYALSDNSTERSDIPNSNTSMSNKDQMPIKSESSNSTVSVLIATPKLLGLEHSYYESVDLPSNKLNMYEDFERNVWTSVSAYIHSCSAEVEDLRVMMRVTYDENAPSIPSQMSVLMYSNDILDRVTVLNIEHKRNSNTSDIGRSVSSLSQAGWVWGDNSAPSSNDIRPVCSLPSEWNFTARNHLTLSSSNNSLSCRSDTVSCGSKTTCGQMANCEEAKNYFEQCGLTSLDGDSDGIPCDNLCI